jgi:hypothetical protein
MQLSPCFAYPTHCFCTFSIRYKRSVLRMCYQADSALQNISRTHTTAFEFDRLGRFNSDMSSLLDHFLTRLATTLEMRKEELRDCNGEVTALAESLDKYMEAWFAGQAPPTTSIDDATKRAFILPCPELHPIPYANLEKLIKQSSGQVGLMVDNNPRCTYAVLSWNADVGSATGFC